jgi:hypothetical protein
VLLLIALATGVITLVGLRKVGEARRARRVARLAVTGTVFLGVLLFAFVPLLAGGWAVGHWLECTGNANVLASALAMYARDWDAYPPAEAWREAVEEYAPYENLFVCPEAPEPTASYAYNRALAGVRPSEVRPDFTTVLIFESDAGPGAAGGPELLPAEPRHDGRDVYGFTGDRGTRHFESAGALSRASIADGTSQIYWEPVAEE